ncbi:MAG: S41 family peptidase [Blastocatellia bacterium]|nr:S41 family peptidase [Blastocatellia bacterium]
MSVCRLLSVAILLLCGLSVARAQTSAPEAPLLKSATTPARNLKVFEALWKRVNEDYFDVHFNGADWGKLREVYRPKAEQAQSMEALTRVLEELLGELKTSHLELTRSLKRSALSSRIGRKVSQGQEVVLSTGVNFDKVGDRWAVTIVRDGSPAAAAGVKIGWEITHANGQPIETAEIEPREGEKIRFGFVDEAGTAFELSLPFQWLAEASDRESRWIGRKLAYVRFGQFEKEVDRWFEAELAQYRGARAIILDLRGNTGGWLYVTEKCLGQFFPGRIAYGAFVKRNREEVRLFADGAGPQAYAGHLLILTDARTASSAEIFAAAIQESGRGRVFGQPTSGQVLPSLQYKLPENFQLTMAVMDFQTARGRRLEGTGVTPDLVTPPQSLADLRRQHDPTLQAALTVLK